MNQVSDKIFEISCSKSLTTLELKKLITKEQLLSRVAYLFFFTTSMIIFELSLSLSLIYWTWISGTWHILYLFLYSCFSTWQHPDLFYYCTVTLEIPTSWEEKFCFWHYQNEALIAHEEEKFKNINTLCLIVRK